MLLAKIILGLAVAPADKRRAEMVCASLRRPLPERDFLRAHPVCAAARRANFLSATGGLSHWCLPTLSFLFAVDLLGHWAHHSCDRPGEWFPGQTVRPWFAKRS
jgi:hypothetical protein